MIKLVAFDWNGTLFADTNIIVKGVNEYLKFFNVKPTTLKIYQEKFDVPIKNMYLDLGVSEEKYNLKNKDAAERFHALYELGALHARTRANANKLLKWLEGKNISSLIFSNHIEEKVILQLNRLKLYSYFSVVLANSHIHSAYKGRLKEEKLKRYIESKNLKPYEVLIIGDTIEEVEIGKKLGCKIVAITDGHCTKKRLRSAMPDFIISNLSQVIGIIDKLNK